MTIDVATGFGTPRPTWEAALDLVAAVTVDDRRLGALAASTYRIDLLDGRHHTLGALVFRTPAT